MVAVSTDGVPDRGADGLGNQLPFAARLAPFAVYRILLAALILYLLV